MCQRNEPCGGEFLNRSTKDEPVHEDPAGQSNVPALRLIASQQTETDYTPHDGAVESH